MPNKRVNFSKAILKGLTFLENRMVKNNNNNNRVDFQKEIRKWQGSK